MQVPLGSPVERGEVIPPGYHKGTEMRLDLVIGGSVTFGAAWLPTALMGSSRDPGRDPRSAFLCDPGRGTRTDGLVILLVLDGIQQAGVSRC